MCIKERIEYLIDNEIEDGYAIEILRSLLNDIKQDGGCAVLAEVRARIEDDMNKLSAAGMSHKITGHIRSLKIIDEFIGEHFS